MEFRGKYDFLSNFYEHPVHLDGIRYRTVEHAYQAAKTLDKSERELIRWAETPRKAKRLGRTTTLRKGWDNIKVGVMYELVKEKFSDPTLRRKLKAINRPIFEGNWWNDKFWGICLKTGKGKNMLGRILMKVRDGI